jgi:hypothetical protein
MDNKDKGKVVTLYNKLGSMFPILKSPPPKKLPPPSLYIAAAVNAVFPRSLLKTFLMGLVTDLKILPKP